MTIRKSRLPSSTNFSFIFPRYLACRRQPSRRPSLSRRFASRRFFPNENPVGRHITVGVSMVAEVVGVAANVHNNGLALPPDAQLYLPFPQLPWGRMNLVVRTAGDPHTAISVVRAQVASVDADQPVTGVQTVNELMDDSRADP